MYNLFKFIEDKRPKYKVPFKLKLLYEPETLTKEDLKVRSDLILMRTPIEKLPNNLTVNGRLDLEGCKNLKSLPSGLKVAGDLDLIDTNITELPLDLKVGGNIYLQRIPIEKLPNNLTVNGALYLNFCKNITSLPSGLKVKETLDLRDTNIKKLPPDLKVGSILNLRNTPLAKKYTTEEELRAKYPDLKVEGNILL